MSTPMKVRGYIVKTSVEYLRSRLEPAEAGAVMDRFSPPVRSTLETVKAIDWYPVEQMAEINQVIVDTLGKGDETRAREVLIACGRYMATEATNTFLRLLMRVLTPGLFAKKLPDLWSRDCSGGKVTVEVDEKRLVCRLAGVKDFAHCGPVSLGWATFALENMGKPVVSSKLHAWSLATPNPDEVGWEAAWKN